MSAEVARILREAVGLVKQGWTTGENARDEDGDDVPARSPDAVCWCAIGAIMRAGSNDTLLHRWGAVQALEAQIGGGVARWNDAQPGPEPVIAALRAAADEAEAS